MKRWIDYWLTDYWTCCCSTSLVSLLIPEAHFSSMSTRFFLSAGLWHCRDSLVSVESSSESAFWTRSTLKFLLIRTDVLMGFGNAMIGIKHKHFEFLLHWNQHMLMDLISKVALVNLHTFIACNFLLFLSRAKPLSSCRALYSLSSLKDVDR